MERIFSVNVLKETLSQKGIDTVVFDLDNTVWDTTSVFKERIIEVCEMFGNEFDEDSDDLFEEMREISYSMEGEFNVRPVRVHLSAILVARQRGYSDDHPIVERVLSVADEIYLDSPEAYEGVREMLWQLKLAGVRIVAVSHAEAVWTERKLHQTNLYPFFDGVACTDVNCPKGEEQWISALVQENVDSQRAMLVCDNPVADIASTNNLGFAYRALAFNGKEQKVNVPDNVVILRRTADLIGALMAA